MTSAPTGTREERNDTAWLVLRRTFTAPITEVWRALTDPDQLERWVGTWAGDPATGQVIFRMTAEGDDAPEEAMHIEACEPPRRLVCWSRSPKAGDAPPTWRLDLQLSEADGVTTLDFAQELDDPESAASIGPGWDYYLDRLVAALTGGEVAAVDFDLYYPRDSDFYRGLFTS